MDHVTHSRRGVPQERWLYRPSQLRSVHDVWPAVTLAGSINGDVASHVCPTHRGLGSEVRLAGGGLDCPADSVSRAVDWRQRALTQSLPPRKVSPGGEGAGDLVVTCCVGPSRTCTRTSGRRRVCRGEMFPACSWAPKYPGVSCARVAVTRGGQSVGTWGHPGYERMQGQVRVVVPAFDLQPGWCGHDGDGTGRRCSGRGL